LETQADSVVFDDGFPDLPVRQISPVEVEWFKAYVTMAAPTIIPSLLLLPSLLKWAYSRFEGVRGVGYFPKGNGAAINENPSVLNANYCWKPLEHRIVSGVQCVRFLG
jgi:hypothetical protein